ncbi:MAG: helix-turn-helix domain-containing protein [Pseudomonadota bacterium]
MSTHAEPDPDHHRTGQRKFTPDEMIAALRQARGIKAAAARILNCSRNTVDKYIAENPDVMSAAREVDQETLDDVEGKLLKLLDKEDPKAIFFYLRHKGKSRGYTTGQEISGPEGEPIPVTHDFSNFTNEELETYHELHRKAEKSVP